MATPPVVPQKVSWLKHVGQFLGKVLHFVSTGAKPIADAATPVLEAFFPQFAAGIQAGDNLVTKIAKQAIVTEAITTGVGAAAAGSQKLSAVVAGIGPEIDAYVAANFPGATTVSSAAKAGLVNAVVAILNELPHTVAPPDSAPATSAPAAGNPAPARTAAQALS